MYTVRAWIAPMMWGGKEIKPGYKIYLHSLVTSIDFHRNKKYALALSREQCVNVLRFIRRNTLPTDYSSVAFNNTLCLLKLKESRKVKNANTTTRHIRAAHRLPRRKNKAKLSFD